MKKGLSLLLVLMLLALSGCAAPALKPAATAVPEETVQPSQSPQRSEGALSLFENTRFLYEQLSQEQSCRVEYPTLALSEEDAGQYAELSRAIDTLNKVFARQGSEVFERILNSARSDAELNVSSTRPYGRTVRLYIPRADERVLSLMWMSYEYSGGAQESVSYGCRSIDSRSGRELALESVMSDADKLYSLLETALTEKYPEAAFYGLADSLGQYMGEPMSFTWTLDYQGLSFYFAPGELAPYGDGAMSVSFRFSEYPGLFSLYYTQAPYVYAIPLIEGECMNFDMDEDARSDKISIAAKYDEGGDYISSLDFNVNGKHSAVSVLLSGYEAYVVHIGPGKNFLVISAVNKNGSGYISAYRLEKSGAVLSGMVYETSLQNAGNSGRFAGKPVLTDPEGFYLGTKIELLSTMIGLKYYSIGNDGLPVSQDSFYQLCTDVILSAVGQLSTATLDAQTGTGNFSTTTIMPGSKVYFWRSDGAGLVDVYTEDGIYCRLYVSGKAPEQYVNGRSAVECFEGMVYN